MPTVFNSAAPAIAGTTPGTLAAGDDARIVGALQPATTGFIPATGNSPAIWRGLADLSTYPGVVSGVLSASARIANGTALQAGLDWCNSNGVVAVLPGLRFEYAATGVQNSRNVGLQVKAGHPGFFGAPGGTTRLVQYASNHPVLTIGDVGTNVNALNQNSVFGSFTLGHGVSQTGQTSADGLLFGRVCYSEIIGPIYVSPFLDGVNPPYVGVRVGTVVGMFFFSNHIGTITVASAQQSFFESNAGGTGNRWDNLYFGNGTFGNRVAMSGPPVNFASSGVDYGSIGQLNIEWCNTSSTLAAAMAVNGDSLTIDHLHMEGVQMGNNFDGPFIQNIIGRLNIGTMKCLDTWIASVNVSGTPKFFGNYGDSRIRVGEFYAAWSGAGTSAEAVATAAFRLFATDTSLVGYKPTVEIGHIKLQGHTGSFSLDPVTPGAAPGSAGSIVSAGSYKFNSSRSRTEDAAIEMVNANMTVYGQHRLAKVTMTATLTANRTLTLSDKLAATGAGATSPRMAGDILEVVRSGAGAFDLVVADQSAATLYTFSGAASANTIKRFEWSGTAWTAL